MIIEAIITPIFDLIRWLISRLPESISNDLSGIVSIHSIMAKGFTFFPPWLWVVMITSVVFWKSANLIWVVIEWIYKKIPGVS